MQRKDKKKLITSFQNLSDEQLELFHEEYENGYSGYIQKITKPDGTPLFVVPLETEDTCYLIKMEVKVDDKLSDEELDKQLFSDQKDPDDADADTSFGESDSDEKHGSKFVLQHGEYADASIDAEDEDDIEDDKPKANDDLEDEDD